MKKHAKCVHCGEKGHIRPTCPKYLAQIESGEIQRPIKANPRANPNGKPTASPKYKMKDRKSRALLSVFQAFYGGDSDSDDSEEDNGAQEQEDQIETTDVENDDNEDIHSFLSMIGSSLKD